MGTVRSFTVEGMTCGHCELTVREEVEELAGVTSAEVDRATGRLTVHGDVDETAIREVVSGAGYTVAVAAAPTDDHES